MSNKKQTAVEWLAEQMLWNEFHCPYLEQAKEIEKQQIMDAYNSDRPLLSCFEDGSAANEYYKETHEDRD
jgi:hypothetical protein